MKKKLMPLALVFVSLSGVAADFAITKTATPYSMLGTARGHSMHRIMGHEYPRGYASRPALVGVSWRATSFPQSVGEKAELCMNGSGGGQDCIPITPGSSGHTEYFNTQSLVYTDNMIIRHSHESGPMRSQPAGSNSVTFHIRY